jgi:hypothetical protein
MEKEQWGTLSITDHRSDLFLKSLIFFDRLVIPVPLKPIYDIDEQELEELSVNVEYLEKHGAAKEYPWDSDKFGEWEVENARELLTVGKRDKFYDNRIMIKQNLPDDVISTPVYGSHGGYESVFKNRIYMPEQRYVNLELAQNLSVPAGKVPLEEIIELRDRPSFKSAMTALRRWRTKILPEVIAGGGAGADKAAKDLKKFFDQYEDALDKSKMKKVKSCVVSFLALGAAISNAPVSVPGALSVMAAALPGVFAVQDSLKPFWKEIEDQDFAAAGVFYEAQTFFNRYK